MDTRDGCQQQVEQFNFLSLRLDALLNARQEISISMSSSSGPEDCRRVSLQIPACSASSQNDSVRRTPARGTTPGWRCIRGTCPKRPSGRPRVKEVASDFFLIHQSNGVRSFTFYFFKRSYLHRCVRSAAPRRRPPETSIAQRSAAPEGCS